MIKLIQTSLLSILASLLMLSSLSASAASFNQDPTLNAAYQTESEEDKKKKKEGEEEPDC